MQYNYQPIETTEPNNNVEETTSHFPIVAIIGAAIGILIPIFGIICGIVTLTNSIQQEQIDKKSHLSDIIFSILLIILCAIRQILSIMSVGTGNISSSPSTSIGEEENLLHLLMPLLF